MLRLREKLEALQRASAGRNELLEDLKALEPSNMAELTARAGDGGQQRRGATREQQHH